MPQKASGCDSLCSSPAECENFLEDGLSSVCASSQGGLKRESGSESDLFPLPGDGMEDLVFGKVRKPGWDMVKKAPDKPLLHTQIILVSLVSWKPGSDYPGINGSPPWMQQHEGCIFLQQNSKSCVAPNGKKK